MALGVAEGATDGRNVGKLEGIELGEKVGVKLGRVEGATDGRKLGDVGAGVGEMH